MRSGSDRCRSVTRPAGWRRPSRTAKPDSCFRNRHHNPSSVASGARSTRSAPRIASTRCGAMRWRGPSVGTCRPPFTARSIARRSRLPSSGDLRLFRRFRHDFDLLVEDDAGERIELADPRLLLEYRFGMAVAGIQALHDSGRAEIDILGVVLAAELRDEQPHDMHPGRTAITGELP